MEVHQLRYFDAVATHLSFSKAAEKCHVSQPSLSTQIQKLESLFGVRLLFRTKRIVRLTPEGEALLPQVRQILHSLKELDTRAQTLTDPLAGILRIGLTPLISHSTLVERLLKLKQASPNIELEICEKNTTDLLEQLREGQLDLIMLPFDERLTNSQFKMMAVETTPLALVLPLGKKTSDVQTLPFIGVPEGCGLKYAMDEGLKRLRHSGSGRLLAHHADMIKKWVHVGIGWSLLPLFCVSEKDRKRMSVFSLKRGVDVKFCVAMRAGKKADHVFHALGFR